MSLEIFDDLMNITDVATTGVQKKLTNLATRKTYILPRFLRNPEGGGQTEIFQGGKKIRMYRMFDEKSTRKHYRPGEPQKWARPQVTNYSEISWRYTIDHMSWTDQEVEHNAGGMNREDRKAAYRDFKSVLEQRFWTSAMNGLEDDLFRQPNQAAMEASDGTDPYSIPCFVNENANGLYTAAASGTWTTLEGVASASQSAWVCQQETYAQLPGADWDLFQAFDLMLLDVGFDQLPEHEIYSEPKSQVAFIATSKQGRANFSSASRIDQDLWVTAGRQDPAFKGPMFGGIPIVYVSNLDTNSLYPGSSTGGLDPEEGANVTASGPRYYWLNTDYIKPVFHKKKYMKKLGVKEDIDLPESKVLPCTIWHNMICEAPNRQGVVSPSADLA